MKSSQQKVGSVVLALFRVAYLTVVTEICILTRTNGLLYVLRGFAPLIHDTDLKRRVI